MRRYLVVANQTLGGDDLIDAIRERMAAGSAEFWVLVPTTPRSAGVGDQLASLSGTMAAGHSQTITELPGSPVAAHETPEEVGSQAEVAEQRLDVELERIRDAGATADGEIGDPDPFVAISQTMALREFDEIIISTLPHTVSEWFRLDLPSRVQRKFHVPVTHIITTAP